MARVADSAVQFPPRIAEAMGLCSELSTKSVSPEKMTLGK